MSFIAFPVNEVEKPPKSQNKKMLFLVNFKWKNKWQKLFTIQVNPRIRQGRAPREQKVIHTGVVDKMWVDLQRF